MIPAITLLLGAALWATPTSDDETTGLATYYAPGLMDAVATSRGLSLDSYAGGVALNRAGDLGRTVWLRWPDGEVTGPYRVVDCARRDDLPKREAQGRVVEVDAQTATRRGFYGMGPTPVTVQFYPPEADYAQHEPR